MDIKAKISALESDVEFRIRTLAASAAKEKASFAADMSAYTFDCPADGKLLRVVADKPCFVAAFFTPNTSMGIITADFGNIRREVEIDSFAYPLFSYLPAGDNTISVSSDGALKSLTLVVYGKARVSDVSPEPAFCVNGSSVTGFLNRYGSYRIGGSGAEVAQGRTFDAVVKDGIFYCVSGDENDLNVFRMHTGGDKESPLSLGFGASEAAITAYGDGFAVAAIDESGDVRIVKLDTYLRILSSEQLTLPFKAESVGFVKGATLPTLVLTGAEGTFVAE